MPRLSLASFNTHYATLPRQGTRRRVYDFATVLVGLDADVVVLQEVWRPDAGTGVIEAAAAELGVPMEYEVLGRATMLGRWPHPTTGRGEGTYGVAVLTKLPMRRIAAIPVGPTRLDPSPCRTVLHVEIDVDGTALQVLGTHLSSRLPHVPMLQLRQLARNAPPPGVPAVIAGDCNFWGPGVRSFLRGWRRAVRGRTWPAGRPHSQIDHVLVRPADVRVLDGRVLDDVGSDHRPVRVELDVPPDRLRSGSDQGESPENASSWE
jgi:endonuclease/exonuclease/phosphatase family metal-dependent hydrolase